MKIKKNVVVLNMCMSLMQKKNYNDLFSLTFDFFFIVRFTNL